MRKVILTSALSIFGMVGAANAELVTWTDTIDWVPDVKLKDARTWCGEWFDGLIYTHDISDEGFSSDFMGGDGIVESFSLEVSLYDDKKDKKVKLESAVILTADNWFTGGEYYDFSLTSQIFEGGLFGKYSLEYDGTFSVWIEPTVGDFMVDWSKLTVNGDNGTAPVPEPSTMLLFGAGALGLVGYSRKRSNKKA